ncbi:MAG TPA: cytochrome P450 [Thermoanaerobaculia bacterium]|nr:cytochrome P450 [Thermoanaerobaculia bacterium]
MRPEHAPLSSALPAPANPIAAVIHPDPYPYYSRLATEPLYREDALGLWVAASASAVTAVLTSELCRVRPPAEPVPRALVGSPAGEIFRQLVRMNDRQDRCPLKAAIVAALGSIAGPELENEARGIARRLAAPIEPDGDPRAVTRFCFALSTHVLARRLGLPPERLEEAASWTGDLVCAFSPAAVPDEIERGKAAAGDLLELLDPRKGETATGAGQALLKTLAREAARRGRDDSGAIAANAIGFLTQAYEATAGLLGNTLLALAAHPDLLQADGGRLRPGVVAEVLRCDPPVQNTRRFLAGTGSVADREMGEGEAVLVVLAAANRDPAANPAPNLFDPARSDRRLFTFGTGAHACPGEGLAETIARVGVEELLAAGVDPQRLAETVTYRPSANTRVPLFG